MLRACCAWSLKVLLGSLTELIKRGKDGDTVVAKSVAPTAAAADPGSILF